MLLSSNDIENIARAINNNDAMKSLTEYIYNAYNAACPIVTKTLSAKRMRKPWISRDILACIKLRNSYSVLWKKNLFPGDRYKQYRNYVTSRIRLAKQQYYSQKFHSLRGDIKKTWKLINSILRPNNCGKPKTFIKKIVCNNTEYEDEKDIAGIINDYFVTVGQSVQESIPPNNIDPITYMRGSYPNSFYFSYVDAADVHNAIQSLKNKPGAMNSVPIKILKAISDIISPVFSRLVNKCITMGEFPLCLKTARVTPIYKGGEHSNTENYRPISVLPAFAKIFEKIVYKQLYSFIEKYNILSKYQYGFRSKMSTNQAIANHLNTLYNNLEQNKCVISIFLDFKKAFDCVDHNVLLSKLSYYGIRGIASEWFKSYLSERSQFTVLGQSQSCLKPVTCGVPQGSNLGPLLFLLFINDLPNCSTLFQFTLFADDSTLTASFPITDVDMTGKINSDLAQVNSWLTSNKIAINSDKTKYISFSYRREVPLALIRIGDVKIKETNDIKFLGVYLDKRLTFKYHVKYIATKLAKSVGMLNKLKYYMPMDVMRNLYLTFVQPYFTYSIQSWFSTYSNNTNGIVGLQKRAIRIITNSDYLAHTGILFKRLKILKLNDLYKLQILMYMYKTIESQYDSKLLAVLTYQTEIHHYNTRNANMFRLPFYTKTMSRFSLQYQGPSLWNELPLKVKDIPSLCKFRTTLIEMFLADY